MICFFSLLLSMTILTTQPAPAKLADLAFFHGAWRVEQNDTLNEEYWSPPRAGTMLGAARTIKGDKTVFFEYFRVEQRGDDLFYIAQPGGKPPTEFKLNSFDGRRAVFENPEHDYPTRVIYEKIDDQTMRASIEGMQNGKKRGTSWEYKRF